MIYLYHSKVQCIGFLMIIMLLYENKYFVEKIEIRKNILKDLTVSLKLLFYENWPNSWWLRSSIQDFNDLYLSVHSYF